MLFFPALITDIEGKCQMAGDSKALKSSCVKWFHRAEKHKANCL